MLSRISQIPKAKVHKTSKFTEMGRRAVVAWDWVLEGRQGVTVCGRSFGLGRQKSSGGGWW